MRLVPRFATCLLLSACASAGAAPIVITAFQFRGPVGGNDEFIEIQNATAANVDISGWRVQGCQAGTAGTAANRVTLGANVVLAPNQFYLFTNNSASGGYSGAVPGDATYGTGVTDFSGNFAGIQLIDTNGLKEDGVGSTQSPCREGTGIATTPATNGAANVFVRTQDTDNNATDFSGPRSYTPHNSGGIVVQCVNDGVRIFQIQGAGHVSPLNTKLVCNVPGIVTQVESNGFFMQDGDGDGDPATSDGIFVFTGAAPTVAAGQQVKIRGTVSEFRPGSSFGATNCPSSSGACNLTVTEITGPVVTPASNLFANSTIVPVVIGAGGRMPPATVIEDDAVTSVELANTFDPANDGIDFYESLEGMQVQVNAARVVGPVNKFGEIWLVGDGGAFASGINARGGITITDGDYNPERVMVDISGLTSTFPLVSVGDTAAVVAGGLSYDFGNFRVLANVMPAFAPGLLQRQAAGVAKGIERLRIASYNVENLDPNDNDICDGAPDRDVANGRFEAFANHIVNVLGSPDILGVAEIQDNSGCTSDGTVDASVTLSKLANAIAAAGGPAYSVVTVNPSEDTDGGVPGGNIRQAIFYNASNVKHVPGTAGAGDATTPTQVSLDAQGRLRLTLSPGRIDPANAAWTDSRKPLAATFDFNGRRVLVIMNHFNSKGGDEPLFGRFQPPVLTSEPQRVQQAQVEHDFIAQALALDANARIATLGDFNDFEWSAPMRTLTGAGSASPILTGLAGALLPPAERYSYVFEGNSQELDHIFVSSALLNADAQFQAVHVNAEYADQLSDHDPLIASFKLLPPPPVANAGADVTVTHKTTVTLDGSASHAGDDSALSYLWTQIAGPAVELVGANAAMVTFTAPAIPGNSAHGNVGLQLTVTDRFGAQATDTVVVNVTPGKPGK